MENLEGKDVKYAITTVHMKGQTGLENQGYFIGLKPLVTTDFEVVKTTDLFIWVYRKGSVHMYSTKYYFMSELTVGYKTKETDTIASSFALFTENESSQKVAIEEANKILEAMEKSKLVRNNGLIDHEKFTDVPTEKKNDIELSSAATGNRSVAPANNRTYGVCGGRQWENRNNATHTQPYVPYKRPEVTTIHLKRTTTYDVTQALTDMATKLKELEAGNYTKPELAKIPADDPTAIAIELAAAKEEKDDDINAYYNAFGY